MKEYYEKLIDWMAKRFMMAAAVRAAENTDKMVDEFISRHHDDAELRLKAPRLPEIEFRNN